MSKELLEKAFDAIQTNGYASLVRLKAEIKAELAKYGTDINVGDFITVTKWLSHHDNSYVGNVLEVKAIDDQFIIVHRHNGIGIGDKITLNLHAVEVRLLSKLFIAETMKKHETVKSSEAQKLSS